MSPPRVTKLPPAVEPSVDRDSSDLLLLLSPPAMRPSTCPEPHSHHRQAPKATPEKVFLRPFDSPGRRPRTATAFVAAPVISLRPVKSPVFPPLPPHPLDLLEQPFARGLKFQLFPFHTEILKDIYIHPIILTLLSRHRLDLLNRLSNFLLAEIVYIKLLDTSDSIETTLEIRISEYEHHYNELMKKYNNNHIRSIYLYDTPSWWCEHIHRFVSVQLVPQKRPLTLVSRISKKKIEQFLMNIIDPTYAPSPVTVPVTKKMKAQSSHANCSPPIPLATQAPISNEYGYPTHHSQASQQRSELECVDNELEVADDQLALAEPSSIDYSEDSLHESNNIPTHEPVSSHHVAATKATVDYDVYSVDVFEAGGYHSPQVDRASHALAEMQAKGESIHRQTTAVIDDAIFDAVYLTEKIETSTKQISPSESVILCAAAESLLQVQPTDNACNVHADILTFPMAKSSESPKHLSSEHMNNLLSHVSQIATYDDQVYKIATYEGEHSVEAEIQSFPEALAAIDAIQAKRLDETVESVAETSIHTAVRDTDTAPVIHLADVHKDEEAQTLPSYTETFQLSYLIPVETGQAETPAAYETEAPWTEYPVVAEEGPVEASVVYDDQAPWAEYPVDAEEGQVEAEVAAAYETEAPWAEYPVDAEEGQIEAEVAAAYETEAPWAECPEETDAEDGLVEASEGQVEASAEFEDLPWVFYAEPEDSAPAALSSMTDLAASSAEEYVPSEAATDMETADRVYSTDEGPEGRLELSTVLNVDNIRESDTTSSPNARTDEMVQAETAPFIDRILSAMINEVVARYAPSSSPSYTTAQTDPGGESYPSQPAENEGNEMISNDALFSPHAEDAVDTFTLESPTIYPTYSTDAEEEPEDDYDYGSYDDDAYETKCALTPKERNMTAFFYAPILAKKEVNNIIHTAIENVLVKLHAV